MKDNLSMVILMILLVLIMIMFPLYNYFERQDDMSYSLVLKATTNFAEEVMNSGYLDQDMYDRYISQIANTGNLYDIELEAHRKWLISDSENPGQYIESSYIDYNNQIFDSVANDKESKITTVSSKSLKDNIYKFDVGDEFYVKVKNSTTTMAGAIFNSIFTTSSKDRIVVNYGGIIKNNSWQKVDSTYYSKQEYTSTIQYSTSGDSNLQNNIVSLTGENTIRLYDLKKDYKIVISGVEKKDDIKVPVGVTYVSSNGNEHIYKVEKNLDVAAFTLNNAKVSVKDVNDKLVNLEQVKLDVIKFKAKYSIFLGEQNETTGTLDLGGSDTVRLDFTDIKDEYNVSVTGNNRAVEVKFLPGDNSSPINITTSKDKITINEKGTLIVSGNGDSITVKDINGKPVTLELIPPSVASYDSTGADSSYPHILKVAKEADIYLDYSVNKEYTAIVSLTKGKLIIYSKDGNALQTYDKTGSYEIDVSGGEYIHLSNESTSSSSIKIQDPDGNYLVFKPKEK